MKSLHLIYIVSVLFLLPGTGCKSEEGVPDLDYPLEVELSGIINKTIGSEDTRFNTTLSLNTGINGDNSYQAFAMSFNAETNYDSEDGSSTMDRLLLRFESFTGFPSPGIYKVSEQSSDSTFEVRIQYNDQDRDSTQARVSSSSFNFRSSTGSIEIFKTENGRIRGAFEIIADLYSGTKSTYAPNQQPEHEDLGFEESAVTLIGEFQIE